VGIELSWAERDLRSLDRLAGEIVVCSMFEGERPPRGISGLLDWRLGGLLSRLCLDGFLTGARGELLLVPGRPRVAFDKIVIVGLGARDAFDAARYEETTAKVLRVLDDLGVRRVTIDLPGRHARALDAATSLQTLARLVGISGNAPPPRDLEAITVVDDGEGQRAHAELSQLRRR
jgi:hypothetical protein